MRDLKAFLDGLDAQYKVDEDSYIRINNRRFVLDPSIRGKIMNKSRLTYAGKYLGKMRRVWEPSSILLREIACQDKVPKVWVKRDTAWLFLCGRDIFEASVERFVGKMSEGNLFLVMNEDSCLGYGRVERQGDELIIVNLFDLGDFLRRERHSIRD